jgi:hypothetical protein
VYEAAHWVAIVPALRDPIEAPAVRVPIFCLGCIPGLIKHSLKNDRAQYFVFTSLFDVTAVYVVRENFKKKFLKLHFFLDIQFIVSL